MKVGLVEKSGEGVESGLCAERRWEGVGRDDVVERQRAARPPRREPPSNDSLSHVIPRRPPAPITPRHRNLALTNSPLHQQDRASCKLGSSQRTKGRSNAEYDGHRDTRRKHRSVISHANSARSYARTRLRPCRLDHSDQNMSMSTGLCLTTARTSRTRSER